ncbi:MAG: transposase [Bacteroidetes bacterium]|nr:transposase [Bacteroidota bacterium]
MLILKLMDAGSIHNAMKGEWRKLFGFGKDVLYKVRNSALINWRSLLTAHCSACMGDIEIESKPKDVSKVSCFIIDDTDLNKRGKCMEFIGKIFSHVSHRYELGYKCLNLAYWSGKHLLHLDFSYHIEMGKSGKQGLKAKELKARYTKFRKVKSPGKSRAMELIKKKTDCAMIMIRRAIKKGFQASYILADSWFFSVALVRFAIKQKVPLISRPKFNNWKYEYNGELYTIGELVKKHRYSRHKKWNRYLRQHSISLPVCFKGEKVKLFLYKEKKRNTKWYAIITTDRKLSALRAYKIYQNRWAIETSYKDLKQSLGYGKCMARDFDAQIADTSQTLMVYNMLSYNQAINDHQSIGGMFTHISRNQLKPTLMMRFWNAFHRAMKNLAEIIGKPIDELIGIIIHQDEFFLNLQKINAILTAET